MSDPIRKVVVVGGVAGGMSTATRLRRNDENIEIVVVERGPYVSFANCGLPYQLGGVIGERDDLLLQTPESLHARFGLDVRVHTAAVSVHPDSQEVVLRHLPSGTETRESYDALVLATGAGAWVPDVPGIERAHTLRDLPDLDRLQELIGAGATTATVIGGGFIGLEVTENLVRRGLSVALVERADQLLTPLDPEMAEPIRRAVVAAGVDVHLTVGVEQIDQDTVRLDDGTTVGADIVVVAAGVRPETALARDAGLKLGSHGGIAVDAQQRTSDPAIFAVGDVAEKLDRDGDTMLAPLAQTANRHGRLVADVICGRETRSKPVLGTAIVEVFGLAVATTGWSEKRLRAAGRDVRVIHTHPGSHAGYYPGSEQMMLKLLVDPGTDEILGAQALGGEGVDKRIDVIATAMSGQLTASDLADLELAYAPQFGSAKDAINMLGMIADNLRQGEPTVQWHQLDELLAEGHLLVDVRTEAEHAAGSIPGAVNLPLDSLRERHHELADRPLVVHCQVGQRGHTATRLLTQLGHRVVNLDGGYRTWALATPAGVDE